MSDKTIVVNFGGEITARTEQDALFQYDTGRRLRFDDIALPAAYSVHFGSQLHAGDAMTQIGNAEGVAIPDQLLETGEYVYAWLWLDGRTERVIVMPVTKRAKPGGEAPGPGEQSVIDQLIEELNAGVETVQAAMKNYLITIEADTNRLVIEDWTETAKHSYFIGVDDATGYLTIDEPATA